MNIQIEYDQSNDKYTLIDAITRGDGVQGISVKDKLTTELERVIHFLKIYHNLPSHIEIRGEVVMKKDVFSKKYSDKYANPRNFVAGILARGYDENDVDVYNDLEIECFDIIDKEGNYYLVNTRIRKITNIEQIRDIYNDFKEKRENYKYLTDGLVVKCGDLDKRKVMGNDKTYPKHSFAIKFPANISETTVKELEWTLTKTKDLNVVAILEPVQLDGTIVKRANACNAKYCVDKGIYKGSTVQIRKAGDIIPQIINTVENDSKTMEEKLELILPKECPVCGHKLDTSDLTHIMCVNPHCEGVLYEKFDASVRVFNIEWLGSALIKRLFDAGLRSGWEIFVNNLPNLLNETHQNTLKVQHQISVTKEIPLEALILSLQIRDSGRTISKELAKMYVGLEYSMFGLQRSVFDDFKNNYTEKLNEIIIMLKNKGVDVVVPKEEVVVEGSINYEMTGSPKEMGYKYKEDFINYVKDLGYIHTKLDKNCDVLFTDSMSSSSSKMAKAKKLGVEIKLYSEV